MNSPARGGIDPGLDGAVVVIDPAGVVHITDTPIFDAPNGRREPDPTAMFAILTAAKSVWPDIRFCLELVQAFPKNGSIGNFKMGQGYGLWQMAIAAAGIPHTMVRPQRWKKTVLDGSAKTPQGEAAIAGRLYPAIAAQLRGPKGGLKEGRVDALLIAHYGLVANL